MVALNHEHNGGKSPIPPNSCLRIVAVAAAAAMALTPIAGNAQEAKTASGQDAKGKICRMEQQCRWENFKKICTYVKVCR
jgi:hypothetical protein